MVVSTTMTSDIRTKQIISFSEDKLENNNEGDAANVMEPPRVQVVMMRSKVVVDEWNLWAEVWKALQGQFCFDFRSGFGF